MTTRYSPALCCALETTLSHITALHHFKRCTLLGYYFLMPPSNFSAQVEHHHFHVRHIGSRKHAETRYLLLHHAIVKHHVSTG